MKKIPLTQGKFALVDDEDYDYLMQWKWCARWDKNARNFYALRASSMKDGKRYPIHMHREILGLFHGDRKLTDHRNHNGLDNRRNNLRLCTHSQNHQNQRINTNTSSMYKGVSRCQGKWRVGIHNSGKKIHLGVYTSEIEAAKIYDARAKELFGEFAHTNFR